MSGSQKSIVLALAGLLLLSGCGSDKAQSVPVVARDNPLAPGSMTAAGPGQALPSQGINQGTPAVSKIPIAALNALAGTYDGFFYVKDYAGGEWPEWSFSMDFGKAEQNGQSYAFVNFRSSGPDGMRVDFESFLTAGEPLRINGGSHYVYSFITKVMKDTDIYPYHFALVLMYAIRVSDGQFDPMQSWMYIYDCRFSQGATLAVGCKNEVEDVWFGNVLIKR